MSSPDQATCETTPLLEDSRPTGRSSTSLSKERFGFSPETLLIPLVIATRLGSAIPSTTLGELLRQTVCRLSNTLHGVPASFVRDPRDPGLCDSPQAVRDFATVGAIFGVIGGIAAFLGCGILSRISLRYGRKPPFLFILIAEITWSCLIPGSQFMPDGLADWTFFVGMLFNVLSSSLPYGYLVDMYIVDVCHPEERTTTMSKIGGWGALGLCIPLALGGSITTKTGNPLIVFYISAAIFISVFIYIISVLPETFPDEKRKELELSRMRAEHSLDETPITTRFETFLVIFEPLKMLVPTRKPGGSRNWRLTWCAIHTFVFVTVNAYALSAWFVIVTSKHHFTPADTGMFFTIVTSTGMIVLSMIVPRLVRFLRPYYRRRSAPCSLADGGLSNDATSAPKTSDHLEVHLAFVSYIIAAIAFLCAAASTTRLGINLSAVFIGLTWVQHPTTRSLVICSVDPLKQGEALAAIEMVHSAGRVLSPIVMGSIFAATIDTTPLLLFHVHLIVVLISAALLLLVRDSDRFRESSET